MADLDAFIARGKAEILEDVRSGRVPATVASFGDLHDHVDANEYAGFCDDGVADALIAEFGGRDADEGMPDGMMDFMNRVQNALDAWIAGGALRGATQ